ncbi:MAG: EamA family transporter, partial [Firmicutes bacterium]|nr:EamA family transporter [Bacillota bacterium]
MNFRSRGNLYIAKMMKTTGERPAEKIAGGRKEYRQGMTSALMCSFFWGILPIYWQLLRPIDSSVIIFYRIVLVAAVSLTGALLFHSREEISAPLKDKKLVAKYALAGLLITVNWSIYIWAVNADFVIQTSIGYYIEPLVVCVFGIVLFKEKLSKYKMIALVFAAAGVAAVIAYFREIPLIALGLALTFA